MKKGLKVTILKPLLLVISTAMFIIIRIGQKNNKFKIK